MNNDMECCPICGTEKQWEDCWNCDEDGFVDHDCGEDVCCCLNPEPNVRCEICGGKARYRVCPFAEEHYAEKAQGKSNG